LARAAARAATSRPPIKYAQHDHAVADLVLLLSAVSGARQTDAATCLSLADRLKVGLGVEECWGVLGWR
jgi:hypothetical protein